MTVTKMTTPAAYLEFKASFLSLIRSATRTTFGLRIRWEYDIFPVDDEFELSKRSRHHNFADTRFEICECKQCDEDTRHFSFCDRVIGLSLSYRKTTWPTRLVQSASRQVIPVNNGCSLFISSSCFTKSIGDAIHASTISQKCCRYVSYWSFAFFHIFTNYFFSL